MTRLVVARGLPGSGKTTVRDHWVQQHGAFHDCARRVGLSRDDLRATLFGGWTGNQADEDVVTRVHREQVERLLSSGVSVFVDDTNLRDRTCREWWRIAHQAGAEFEVHDLRDVDLQTCIDRSRERHLRGGRLVPEQYIREQHERFIRGRDLSAPLAPLVEMEAPAGAKYVGNPDLPDAWIVDIDGTLACHTPHRSPYDTSKYDQDTLILPVAELVQALYRNDQRILFTSGRSRSFYWTTYRWLERHGLVKPNQCQLIMRHADDQRRDDVVKLDLFNESIRNVFNVRGAIDDRDRCVKLWRDTLGLVCLQANYGAF